MRLIFVACIWTTLFVTDTSFVGATVPSVLHIGGLFNPYDESGAVDPTGVLNLAAFLMAVDEINAKTVDRTLLPGTTLKVAVAGGFLFEGAVQAAMDLREMTYPGGDSFVGVDAVVGTLPNVETAASDEMFVHPRVVQMSSVAASTDFTQKAIYPYRASTIPVDSCQGQALQDMICSLFQYRRISIFTTNTLMGAMGVAEVTDQGYCELTVISVHTINEAPDNSDTTIWDADIALAAAAGADIFLVFMDPITGGVLLDQGYRQTLFHEGTQVFGNADLISPDLLKGFSAETDVVATLRGFVGVQLWADYNVKATPEGQAFLHRWRLRPQLDVVTTGPVDHKGFELTPIPCNNAAIQTDTVGHKLFGTVTPSAMCTNVHFSDFTSASDLPPSVAYTYDAVYALAYGMDTLLKQGYAYPTTGRMDGDRLINHIVANVSFPGATGDVSFYEDPFQKGSRESGFRYKIVQFNDFAYANPTIVADPVADFAQAFTLIGSWTDADGPHLCSVGVDGSACTAPVYHTVDGLQASDSPPFTYAKAPAVVKIGGLFRPFFLVGNGSVDVAGAQYMAAFIMAVREINDKSDGVHDDLLPHTHLTFSTRTLDGACAYLLCLFRIVFTIIRHHPFTINYSSSLPPTHPQAPTTASTPTPPPMSSPRSAGGATSTAATGPTWPSSPSQTTPPSVPTTALP